MKRFGLIGEKLSHSYSPYIHGQIGGYEYGLYPQNPDALADFVKNCALDGFNVTIPYKQDIIPFCNTLTEKARIAGSVNTVLRCKGGTLLGDNTDFDGFSGLLDLSENNFAGKPALVLGSGGSSKTVCAVLKSRQIPYTVISRSGSDNYKNIAKHHNAELIINTTPVGMYPNTGAAPINLSDFKNCKTVIDLIYNPFCTRLLWDAKCLGIEALNGLYMLTLQGVLSARLFTGKDVPKSKAKEIADKLYKSKRNITLVGMAGCGKTVMGEKLSKISGRKWADTDSIIKAKYGMSPQKIITQKGEAFFRNAETEVLKEISKENGLIISAGGGVVTKKENLHYIKQNGICVFLDTNRGSFNTKGRPLSQAEGADNLFAKRLPLYQSFGDCTYTGDNFDELAQLIAKELEL